MFCSGPLPTIGSTRSDVLHDGKVGAARAAGHDRHNVLVHARAEVLAHIGGGHAGFGLGQVLGARAGSGGGCDQTKSEREGDTHDNSLMFERAPLVRRRMIRSNARKADHGSGRSPAGNGLGEGPIARRHVSGRAASLAAMESDLLNTVKSSIGWAQ
jgi:hypothetical protein